MNDERFSHVGRDPKFRSMPRKLRKVKIDKRFNAMFKDNRFKLKYTVDKRGRPVNFSSSEDLKRYYDTNDNSDDDDEEDEASEEEDAEETEATTGAAAADEGGSDASEDQASPEPETSLPKPAKIKGKKSSKLKADASSASKTPKTKAVKDKPKSDDSKPAKIDEDAISSQPSKLKDSQTSKKKSKKKQQQLPESDDEGEPLDEAVRGKLLDLAVDYARGGGVLAEDSSSDEESEPEEEELEHDWAELDRDADRIDDEEVTSRLAVCNMDWDRIKAVDIMVLLHSFLPPGGVINEVTVYPSEFGKKKMAEEEERGPSELFNKEDAAGSSDDEDGAPKEASGEALEHSQMEHVRRYQLSRLRYYYAIVTCDSPTTASKLYEECEGLEFESSASRVDLRFVPDDMTFDETPREECTSLPEAGRYRPSKFVTTALQQRQVRFTWDETDVDRQEAVRQAMEKGADADDANLRAYLADSSDESAGEAAGSEDEEGAVSEKERIAKYRALLAGGDDDDGDDKEDDNVEMEITWGGVGIKEKTEEIVKKKEQEKNLTPWEKYIDKQKQKKKDDKKKAKPAAEEGSLDSDSSDGSDGDSDVPSDLADDPFFKEELDTRRKEADKQKKRKKKQSRTNGAGEEEDTGDQDQLALLTMEDGEEDSRRHFNFKQIVKDETSSGKKKKWKKKRKPAAEATQQDDFQVDVSDPRFAKLYDSANFNVDPSDTRFKRTSGMERLVKEKQRRVAAGETRLEEPEPKKSRTDKLDTGGPDSKPAEDLGALVSNIKSRAKHLARKKQNSAKR